ncbi:MAG: NUDIX hydrolase [Lachnospiraceae bacterium]|nr:NUDIX hydrolase [Lachnospiraceae bacterium]
MATIHELGKLTESKFLNMYNAKGSNSKGHHTDYYFASRASSIDTLKLKTHENKPDGVAIYSLYGEKHDRVVLIRQYRYPLDGYIYEFPAGLCEAGEDFHTAATRELHEETGLTFKPIDAGYALEAPRFTSIGLTDESVATVYGYAEGEISDKYMEKAEEIEVVLADKDEIRRILKEENVALICAYQLMHFLVDEEPFGFLKKI